MENENIKVEDKNIKENMTKTVKLKVGRYTFGVFLIIFGLAFILDYIFKLNVLKYLINLWPLLFISLGVETLYLNKKANGNLKYDIAGGFWTALLIIFGICIGAVSYAFNNFLNEENIKQYIVSQNYNTNFNTYYDNNLVIKNVGGEKVKVKLVEDENYEISKIYIKENYNKDKIDQNNVFDIMNSLNSYMDYDRFDDTNQNYIITFLDDSEYIDNVEITILTNDTSKIKLDSNIEKD